MSPLEKKLENPSNEYRALPFWSWNDKLDPKELKWQINEMHDKGIGGFFMHARGGLKTRYMDDEWMECIRTSAEEAEQLGMEAWLYDEEGWPSGFAGGRVTALGAYYHMRWMEQEFLSPKEIDWSQNILGIYAEDGGYLGNDDLATSGQDKVYVVYEKINPYYVDILNQKVVEKFLEVTHEQYLKYFPDELGKTIPGFFTDEPQFAKLKIPYSLSLPEQFEKENGYPVEKCYTALFREAEGYEKYRYDFWKTISRMYTNSFCRTIHDWCEKHGCSLTGHLMREDSLLMQMQATAGVMPSYEYIDMPGIDWLRRRISSPLTPKQAGSVAAQLGKKAVISEMFAMVGWNCTPEELKWIAQWQYVNGVTRMCQHLEAYSLKGIRKRDFPPSLFYQQSWWEIYRKFNDYFARLGVLLTEGSAGTEVLLLHPMRSGWILYNGKAEGKITDFGQAFEDLSQWLSDNHIEHHYGDEEIIKKYGSVDGQYFRIGKCAYKTVLIPDMVTIERSTAELLLKFAQSGGKIFSMGKLPELVEGKADEELTGRLKNSVAFLESENAAVRIKQMQEFPVSIAENGKETPNIHIQLRNDGKNKYLYVVSLDRCRNTSNVLTVPGNWRIYSYDPLENVKIICSTNYANGTTTLKFDFTGAQSAVYIMEPGSRDESRCMAEKADRVFIGAGGRWDIIEAEANSLTLDYCSYRIENGRWMDRVPVIRLMDILLKEKRPVHVSLKFEFCIEDDPLQHREIYLAAEVPEILKACINGTDVEIGECGWWKDKSFRKYDIRPYLKKGQNEIILEIDFVQQQKVYDVLFGKDVLETEINKLTYDTEIESIYIIGDFGVYNRNGYQYSWRKELICDDSFYLKELPDCVYGDDFTSQGFCFFAGKIKVKQKLLLHEYDDSKGVKIVSNRGKRYIYRFGRLNAMAARLFINGQWVKDILWQPYECDITDYVHLGENEIVWELYASNRNLLGPLHHVDGELYAVWPADFTDTPHEFKEDQRNVWSDEYHFVKFGVQGGSV